ncbi:hypothetical protein ACFE04_029241 [Oxalis oulophora]
MKEVVVDKKRTPNSNTTKTTKRVVKNEKKERKPLPGNRILNAKGTETKVRHEESNVVSTEAPEVYENLVIHYVDDLKANTNTVKDNETHVLDDHTSDLEKDHKHGKEEESDSVLSQGGESTTTEDDKVDVSESTGTNEPIKSDKEASKVPVQEFKEVDLLDSASNGTRSVGSDSETVDIEDKGERDNENEEALRQKVEDMESKIEKLQGELREVAALEISLYAVVAEHGSSAHKVHTPARRLSRLYIHACKHWAQRNRATIARNTVSGLVLIAKSCGNDVSRLTYWLSNTITLREIISQAFGSSRKSSPALKIADSNGSAKRKEALKQKEGSKQVNDFVHLTEDWQETGSFTSALEKVEGWMFTRLVESVWWQAITPYMQPSVMDSSTTKFGRVLGPSLGDQQKGSFAVNLWKNAFQDTFQRLCPVRAGGHECGCLSVLARMVMDQCVARLDVAMFNALLRESVHQIPTDPVSDPIVDPKVLPVPAGDLSFGSGALLKNAVGNWSRWFTDKLGICMADVNEDQPKSEDAENSEPKSFLLLNSLSDLLMLPKDLLMDRSIRMEVCPSISLELVKRILCNFTPDEFCPDPVPGAVLEALNAESIIERRVSGDTSRSFPYTAAQVIYMPPSSVDVAENVAEVGWRSQLSRNASVVQRKGYTSDEELEELDSPVMSIVDKLPPSPRVRANGKHMVENSGYSNARYELLREVWSASM